jgi:hypothetical protein
MNALPMAKVTELTAASAVDILDLSLSTLSCGLAAARIKPIAPVDGI